jgi:hypothetical protein
MAEATADELLKEARAAYLRGETNYRDAMLEAGRLLQRFVHAWLRRGDEMKTWERQKQRVFRQEAVKEAAGMFAVERWVILRLLATAAVADLLGAGGLGGLGYMAITAFRGFVKRKTVGTDGRKDGNAEVKASDFETWEIKPGLEGAARSLFRRAVAENWSQARVWQEVIKSGAGKTSQRGQASAAARLQRQSEGRPVAGPRQLREQARAASPGDVAEMCLDLIRAAEDPWAVAQRLTPELAKFRRDRERNIA